MGQNWLLQNIRQYLSSSIMSGLEIFHLLESICIYFRIEISFPLLQWRKFWEMTLCHGDFRVALLCCVTLRTNTCGVSTIYDMRDMRYRDAEVSTHAYFSLIAFIKQLVKWKSESDRESVQKQQFKFIESYRYRAHDASIECIHLYNLHRPTITDESVNPTVDLRSMC